MGFFVKKDTNTWTTANSIWIKAATSGFTSNGWTTVKKAFVKAVAGWVQFWPKSGPYTPSPPFFSTDTAGTTLVGTTTPLNSIYSYASNGTTANTIYGQTNNTSWVPNGVTGVTITSFAYKLFASTVSSPGGSLGSLILGPTSVTTYASIDCSNSSFDGKYLTFEVTATRSDGVTGVDSSDTFEASPPATPRPIVIKRIPTANSTSLTYNSLVLTYSTTWNVTPGYIPDSNRSSLAWYSSTVGTYTTPAQVLAGGTPISSGVSTTSFNNTTGVYTSTLTLSATPSSTIYYYVLDKQQNSYTDFVSTPVYALSGGNVPVKAVYSAPTQLTSPTLIAQDSSGNTKTTNITSGDKFIFTKGTYSNASSVGTYLQWGSTLASASSTQGGYVGYDATSPHTISTAEASAQYYFIVRDIVIDNNGNSYNFFGNSYQVVQPLAAAPNFGPSTTAAGGFTSYISDDDSRLNRTYSASLLSTTSTTTPVLTWGTKSSAGIPYIYIYPFTVSNMSQGSTATFTITASQTGYTSNSANVAGTAAVAPDAFSYSVSNANTTPDAPTGVTIIDDNSNNFRVTWSAPTSSTNIDTFLVSASGVKVASYFINFNSSSSSYSTVQIPFTSSGTENAYVISLVYGATVNVSTTNNANSWTATYNITGSGAGTGTGLTQTSSSMPMFIRVRSGNTISLTAVSATNGYYTVAGSAGSPTSAAASFGQNRTDASPTQLTYHNPAPTNTVAPSATPSTVYLGKTASTTNGTWSGASSYSYEWFSQQYRSTVLNFFSAVNSPYTNSTYVVAAGDLSGVTSGSLRCLVTAYADAGQTGNYTYIASNTISAAIADTPAFSQNGTSWTFSNTSNNIVSYSWCVASTSSTSAISYNFSNGSSGVSNTWSATSGNTIYSQGTANPITVGTAGRYIHVIGFVQDPLTSGYYASPRAVSSATTVATTTTTTTTAAPTTTTTTTTTTAAPTTTTTTTTTAAPTTTTTTTTPTPTGGTVTCTCYYNYIDANGNLASASYTYTISDADYAANGCCG